MTAQAAAEVYENHAGSTGAGISDLAELWAFRSVVTAFAQRTIRVRYKETFLGLLWVVVQPLSVLLPFIIVLGNVAGIGGAGAPYAAFSTAVIPGWQAVASGLSLGAPALVAEGPLLRKVYFPRSAPVAGAVLAGGFDLVVSTVISVPVVYILGGHPSWWALTLPLYLLLIEAFAFSLALVLAGLYIHYRDIRFLLPLLTQALLYASPVAYPFTKVPGRYRLIYSFFNPIAGPLDALRRTVAVGVAPDWGYVGAGAVSTVVVMLVGQAVFGRLQNDAADLV